MSSIAFIFMSIAFGGVVGTFVKQNKNVLSFCRRLSSWTICILLFFLGTGIGTDPTIFEQLPFLGFEAFIIAIFASFGSIFALIILQPFFPSSTTDTAIAVKQKSPFIETGIILSCFALGIFITKFHLLPAHLFSPAFSVYSLCVLTFTVGVGLGADLSAFSILRERMIIIICVPLLIAVGTSIGSLCASLFLPEISIKESLAVGFGFGYYSLSSIIIGEAGYANLAVIALLSNIFRELFTLVSSAFLVRFFGILAPTASAGATGMDTCLPIIARLSGERVAIISIFSGMVLSLAAPLLVSFTINL